MHPQRKGFCLTLIVNVVNYYVAAGCSNVPSDKVSLFKLPKNPALKAQCEKQVQKIRAKWKAGENSHLCGEHFTPESFEVDSQLAAQFGIKKKKKTKA